MLALTVPSSRCGGSVILGTAMLRGSSILFGWACFDRRQNHLRDVAGRPMSLRRTPASLVAAHHVGQSQNMYPMRAPKAASASSRRTGKASLWLLASPPSLQWSLFRGVRSTCMFSGSSEPQTHISSWSWIIAHPGLPVSERPPPRRPAGRCARPRPPTPASNGVPACPGCGRSCS